MGEAESVIWGRVTLPSPTPKFERHARFPFVHSDRGEGEEEGRRREGGGKKERKEEKERSFQRELSAALVYASRVYIRAIDDERASSSLPWRPHSTCFPVHHRSSRSPRPVPKTFSPAVFG